MQRTKGCVRSVVTVNHLEKDGSAYVYFASLFRGSHNALVVVSEMTLRFDELGNWTAPRKLVIPCATFPWQVEAQLQDLTIDADGWEKLARPVWLAIQDERRAALRRQKAKSQG